MHLRMEFDSGVSPISLMYILTQFQNDKGMLFFGSRDDGILKDGKLQTILCDEFPLKLNVID